MNANMVKSKSLTSPNKYLYLLGTFALFISMGVYNSYNNNIFIEQSVEYSPIKRLDELKGNVKIAKKIIMAKPIAKIVTKKPQFKFKRVTKKVTLRKVINKKPINKVTKQATLLPLVTGELNLIPTIVFNTARGEQIRSGLSGGLQISEGILSSLTLNLPSGESLDISSNREMNGNVFQYYDSSHDQEFSGMFYQISKNSYMITLTNHPGFEGLRIQFNDPNAPIDNTQVASNSFRKTKPVRGFKNSNNNQASTQNNYQNDYAQLDNTQNSYNSRQFESDEEIERNFDMSDVPKLEINDPNF